MGYPNSVFAPTTKNDGDTIFASHIDDLQTEVVAIESGLLNGTGPINSSHSTLASLSVTGGSTLAGANITGNSTLSTATIQVPTLGSTMVIGTLPYIWPASGGSSGQMLAIASTSGSTMTLAWQTPLGQAMTLLGTSLADATTASTTLTQVKQISGLSVDSNTTLIVDFAIRQTAAMVATDCDLAVQVNGSNILWQNSTGGFNTVWCTAGGGAGAGLVHFQLGPRSATYDRSVSGFFGAQGADLGHPTKGTIYATSTFSGTVTSVEIKLRGDGSATVGAGMMKVYAVS